MAKQTILLVDQETDFLDWAKHLLESTGTRVLTETSADSAYKSFCMETPELVMAELNLSPFSGIELLALRRPFPHMMRTVWGDHARYRQYWEEFPGNVYAAGDVASWDKNGYITVLGRSDDVLNVAGHRIGTADVESALVSHPAVAEAAVIGVPDEIKGEAIQAFVLLRAGQKDSVQLRGELVEHVRHVLGPIATPSGVRIVDRLPKTRSGKIVRRLLKAQALGKDAGDLSTLEE